MGKRVADQHAVMDRGWQEADRLARVISSVALCADIGVPASPQKLRDIVRRYEEARQS